MNSKFQKQPEFKQDQQVQKIQNEFVPPRIIRQLEKRGLVKLKAVK